MEQERILALALCRVEGIGAVSIRKLLEKAGDVSEIRKLPAESLQKLLGENFLRFFVGRSVSKAVEGNFRSTVGAV